MPSLQRSADLVATLLCLAFCVATLHFDRPGYYLRVVFAFPTVLLAPGYALVAGLLPRRDDLDVYERLALSCGLSLALLSLLALALNYTHWGVSRDALLTAEGAVILAGVALAALRRARLPADEAFGLRLDFAAGIDTRARVVGGGVAGGTIVLAALTLVSAARSSGTTSFYLLSAEGGAGAYQRELNVGGAGSYVLGIANDQASARRFSVEAHLGGDVFSVGSYALPAGGKVEINASIQPTQPGTNQALEFLLYRDGDQQPYRRLRLYIDVAVPGPPTTPPF